jgi:hypothetical protein
MAKLVVVTGNNLQRLSLTSRRDACGAWRRNTMDDWPDFGRVDWKDVYPRLLLATVGRLRRSRWRRACEMHATDFVQTAIEKAMSRQRSWDPNRSLFQNLWQVVSSEVSHAAASYENKKLNPVDETVVQISDDYGKNPEDTVIYRSQVDHLLNYLRSHDADAASIANLILNVGIAKSIELSVQLERPVHEIENIKKRLRRHCQKYQQEQEPNTLTLQTGKVRRPGDLT